MTEDREGRTRIDCDIWEGLGLKELEGEDGYRNDRESDTELPVMLVIDVEEVLFHFG